MQNVLTSESRYADFYDNLLFVHSQMSIEAEDALQKAFKSSYFGHVEEFALFSQHISNDCVFLLARTELLFYQVAIRLSGFVT
ncbi:hypothetical protein Ciccas_003873 [Cichlidogyrus casuarinus]|uniref:Uncharacterized protein n=1 Tax=Cichlidogyrus casuarinus TaxID=1844966 RepID=A0ABD2QD44_9PLAT